MQPLPEPLPHSRPGTTPDRYLSWIGRHQWRSILAGCGYDVVWLVGLALVPWAIGRAIDEGTVARDGGRLTLWVLVLLGLVVLHAAVEGLRDRGGSYAAL